jgi:hypothetical protein
MYCYVCHLIWWFFPMHCSLQLRRLKCRPLLLRQILETIQEVHRRLERSPQVFPRKLLSPLLVTFRQRQRGAEDVADLSPVQECCAHTLALHTPVQVSAGANDSGVRHFFEDSLEDLVSLLLGEVFVLDREGHAGLHANGGQDDDDAFVVLDAAEEYVNECVAVCRVV